VFCFGYDIRNFVRQEVYSVSRFLWPKHVCPIEINRTLIGVYGDVVLKSAACQKMMQRIRKWSHGHPR
jgi:hypothetical protein